MNVLSAFTDQKKIRPLYQFKRGNTFSSFKSNGLSPYQQHQQHQQHQQLSSGLTNNISPTNIAQQPVSSASSSSSTAAAEEHVDATPQPTPNSSTSTQSMPDVDDAIFDFPDSFDEFSEIKVMVASTRRKNIHEAPPTKLTRKRSKPKKTSPKATPVATNKKKNAAVPPPPAPPTSPATNTKKRPISNNFTPRPIAPSPPTNTAPIANANQEEFDIFAFDPQPTSHLSFKCKNLSSTTTTRTASRTSTRPTNSINPYNPVPVYQNSANQHHVISIASLLNETIPVEAPPVEKKRKRNLVAHLKTARGEKDNKHLVQEFDCLSDEDDLALDQQQLGQQKSPLMPLNDIIKGRSLSPELTYEETMQMQLDSLMRTEFEDPSDEKPAVERKSRPQYQPLNKLNVRVTFQKK